MAMVQNFSIRLKSWIMVDGHLFQNIIVVFTRSEQLQHTDLYIAAMLSRRSDQATQ